jgi:hypothetical protein
VAAGYGQSHDRVRPDGDLTSHLSGRTEPIFIFSQGGEKCRRFGADAIARSQGQGRPKTIAAGLSENARDPAHPPRARDPSRRRRHRCRAPSAAPADALPSSLRAEGLKSCFRYRPADSPTAGSGSTAAARRRPPRRRECARTGRSFQTTAPFPRRGAPGSRARHLRAT